MHKLITDSSKLEYGQTLKVELNEVRDRLPKDVFAKISMNVYGKLVGYKIVDGNQFGFVLEFEAGIRQWFFEQELTEPELKDEANA